MKKVAAYISFLVIAISCGFSNEEGNPYGLEIISSTESYQASVAENTAKQVLDIQKEIPGIAFDIRYASTNNFTGQVMYPQARAFARKPVVEALKNVQAELNAMGLGLKIFDAYRPYAITLKFYEVYPDTNYVAAPWKGSRHNRGCAIDLTLIDLQSGAELEMPTHYDDFTEKAWHNYSELSDEALKNRALLREVMTHHGFEILDSEWWHYDYQGWKDFELMDLSFEELSN
jgi:zinc D-Ala-D-Ala dipeptidase